MFIISNEELGGGWPITSFEEAYRNVAGGNILKCFAIARGNVNGNPDDASVIFVRLFVENGERAKKDQKYIVGLRFFSFGDSSTIDIISMDKSNHRDIIEEHAKRMSWLLPDLTVVDAFKQSYSMPIFAIGAHLQISDKNELVPFGSSCDFGNNLLGFEVNEVVKQLSFLCGLRNEESEKGENFLEDLLAFMLQNKQRHDFYEVFAENYIKSKLSGQNFGGLLMMKVFDRLAEEGNENFLKLIVEEMTDGFAKWCLLIGGAQSAKQ